MSEWTGKGIDRIDGHLKVTGQAAYAADTAVAHVLYAVIVGSRIAAGRVASVDARAAEAAGGVLAVLTSKNAPKLAGAAKKASPVDKVLELLQDDVVHYDGQPVALVVADTLERAQHAASLVAVRYEEGRPSVVMESELGAAYEPASAGPGGAAASRRGDFDVAFDSAPKQIEETYTTPIEHHNPMEMHGTIAVWQGNDRLTVYDATQGIFGVRKRLAALFGIPAENVRVISRFLGGGFGCKGSMWSHVGLAVMAARVTGRPVKLVLQRSQMFQLVGYRPRTIQKVSLGARADGTLVAMRHDVLAETSRFDEFVESCAKLTRMLYACPNVTTAHRVVPLDVSTPTFMRAPGEASGSFALESAMDELAYALAMDPIALRLKNHADTDLDAKKPFSSKSLKECYRQGADRFGWSKRTPGVGSMRDGRTLVGQGMATATYPAHQWDASALARVRADGTAIVLAGSQDIGTGTYTIMTQIAADALGLPIDKVTFDLGDTTLPEAPVSGGSQTASSVGSAVKLAALAVRDAIAKLAAADARSALHGLTPDAMEARDGALVSKKDPSKSDTYADILRRAGRGDIEERVDSKEKADRKRFSLHAFGAHFVEVRVAPDLGEVRVSRVVSAFAAGRILNPKTAKSQLLGGIVMGIGLALEEDTARDARTGRVVTKDLADYHVPVSADVPEIDVIMIHEDDPYVNEIGAKGIGEIGVVGPAAAIANAVYHATGKRVRDLPITLDKLLS